MTDPKLPARDDDLPSEPEEVTEEPLEPADSQDGTPVEEGINAPE